MPDVREIEIHFAGRGLRIFTRVPVLLGGPGLLLITYLVARLTVGDAPVGDKLVGLTAGALVCGVGLAMVGSFIWQSLPFRAWIAVDRGGLTIHHSRAFRRPIRFTKDDVELVVVDRPPRRQLAVASRRWGKQWHPPGALTLELPNVLIRLRRPWEPAGARWTLRVQWPRNLQALWLAVRSPEAAIEALDGWNVAESLPADVEELAALRTTWRNSIVPVLALVLYFGATITLVTVLRRNGLT